MCILTEPENAEQVANGIQSILNDPQKRYELGIAGKKRAYELCDPARQFETLELMVSKIAMKSNTLEHK